MYSGLRNGFELGWTIIKRNEKQR